jgi:LysM repeat protein
MSRIIIWLLAGFLLTSCGRLVTPTVELAREATVASLPLQVVPTNTSRPTATPRPATPLASPTPTITPTPTIYTVEAGDTLLKIAIQFDRSIEAIQEINGIVDPRFLQIGQELIIPSPVADPADPPTPVPTPPPVLINAINFQNTPQGTLWSLGQVSNPGDEPLTEVVIEASLFDGTGVLLAKETAFTQLDVIPPGQSVPFAILFESPPSEFAQYQVTAVAGVPLSNQARYYFDFETFDLQGSPEGVATYRLTGQLRNSGSTDAESIRLVAVAYDEDNKILAQRQAELAVSLLKAGATTPFEINLIIPQGVVDHYNILVQGLKAQ